MAKGALRLVFSSAAPTITWSDDAAPPIISIIIRKKIQTMKPRSQ
jgi:hypothetical protein